MSAGFLIIDWSFVEAKLVTICDLTDQGESKLAQDMVLKFR